MLTEIKPVVASGARVELKGQKRSFWDNNRGDGYMGVHTVRTH